MSHPSWLKTDQRIICVVGFIIMRYHALLYFEHGFDSSYLYYLPFSYQDYIRSHYYEDPEAYEGEILSICDIRQVRTIYCKSS